MTVTYVLTAAAEADLRDVIRYTRKQWGDDQTRSYVAKLTRCIERMDFDDAIVGSADLAGRTPFWPLAVPKAIARGCNSAGCLRR